MLPQRDVYRREDIKNALNAVMATSMRMTQVTSDPEAYIFTSGFVSAIQSVASAFGLDQEIREPSYWVPEGKYHFVNSPQTEDQALAVRQTGVSVLGEHVPRSGVTCGLLHNSAQ